MQGIAINGISHQPPKGITSSPDIPTLCINNAKYENP
jgi:hypothetical protein